MARALQQLTIFVSGPVDVDAEKAALRVVAEEISQRFQRTEGIILRVVGWPDDVRPGVNVDPQAEITRQIGQDFDVYIGILGSRFGTPTARRSSGTEEEFEIALSRFRSDTTSVRLLFYFNHRPVDPFSLDLEQLGRVRQFREGLGEQGVLYGDFADTADFTEQARNHLDGLIAEEWQSGSWSEVNPVSSPSSMPSPFGVSVEVLVSDSDDLEGESEQQDDETGLLEDVMAFHEAAAGVSATMNALTEEARKVGATTAEQAGAIDGIRDRLDLQRNVHGTRTQQQLVAEMTACIDRTAECLDGFVKATVPLIEQYRSQTRDMFDRYRRVHAASAELGSRDTSDDREQLSTLVEVIESSRQQLMTFQASVSGVPALTGRFKRSRRRTAATLGELIAEMSVTVTQAKELLEELARPTDT